MNNFLSEAMTDVPSVAYHYTKSIDDREFIIKNGFKLSRGEVCLSSSQYVASGYGIFGVAVLGIDNLTLIKVKQDEIDNVKGSAQYDGLIYTSDNGATQNIIIWNEGALNSLPRYYYFDRDYWGKSYTLESLNSSNFTPTDLSQLNYKDTYMVPIQYLKEQLKSYNCTTSNIVIPCIYAGRGSNVHISGNLFIPLEKYSSEDGVIVPDSCKVYSIG